MTISSMVVEPIRIGASGEVVRLIQEALVAAGAELVMDGDFGEVTEAAVKRFQAAHGLAALGYVGPKTAAKLDVALKDGPQPPFPVPAPLPSILKVAPHLATMRAITGTKEVPGAADSKIILAWNETIARTAPDLAKYAKTYTHDSIPWCGQTVAYTLAANGLHPVEEYLWAANWGEEGKYLVQLKPPYPQGAIMVYTRSGGGHVSLLEESGDGWDNIRGGNQSDMVNVTSKSRDAFSHATWPRALPIPTQAAPRAKVKGRVSGSEA